MTRDSRTPVVTDPQRDLLAIFDRNPSYITIPLYYYFGSCWPMCTAAACQRLCHKKLRSVPLSARLGLVVQMLVASVTTVNLCRRSERRLLPTGPERTLPLRRDVIVSVCIQDTAFLVPMHLIPLTISSLTASSSSARLFRRHIRRVSHPVPLPWPDVCISAAHTEPVPSWLYGDLFDPFSLARGTCSCGLLATGCFSLPMTCYIWEFPPRHTFEGNL